MVNIQGKGILWLRDQAWYKWRHEQRRCNQRFLWEYFRLIVCEDRFGVGFVREFEIGEP